MGRMNFEKELKELHLEMIEMGNCSTKAIKKAIKAFKTNDAALCQSIIENDKEVNAMEKRIESRCLWLIAREQPVASDLRLITTALKMITDMERIGDQGSDIAEISQHTIITQGKNSVHIAQMSDVVICMVLDAVRSFVKQDAELAKSVEAQDDKVDNLFFTIKQDLLDMMCSGIVHKRKLGEEALETLMIAKYLERIGDHIVNIAECACCAR